jgi:hypothetical protein
MDEQDKKMLLDYFNKRYTLDGKVKAKDKIVKKERKAEPKEIEVEEEQKPKPKAERAAQGRAEAKPKPKAERAAQGRAEAKQKAKPERKKIVVEDESGSEDENDESSNVQQSEPIPIPVVKHQPRFAGFGSFF